MGTTRRPPGGAPGDSVGPMAEAQAASDTRGAARRRPAVALVAAAAAAAATFAGAGAGAAVGGGGTVQPTDGGASPGERLYLRDCGSCHGPRGEGTARGPTISDAGAAGADFVLATGRMPLVTDEVRRRPRYGERERAAIVDHVASLGTGPAVPRLRPSEADVARGGVLYRRHCAACHGTTGAGTALAFGAIAPPIAGVAPVQVAEAAVVGPGAMPPFSPEVLSADELDDLVAYVAAIESRHRRAPLEMGGARLGEAAVALGVGLAAVVLAATLLARRR